MIYSLMADPNGSAATHLFVEPNNQWKCRFQSFAHTAHFDYVYDGIAITRSTSGGIGIIIIIIIVNVVCLGLLLQHL